MRNCVYYVLCGLVTAAGLVTAVADNDQTCKSVIKLRHAIVWSDAIEGFQFLVLPCVVDRDLFIILGRRLGLPRKLLDSPRPGRVKSPPIAG